jgi:hypothetical protein
VSVRLRDEAILLEPATSTDAYTGDAAPDWKQLPASATPAPFYGSPVSTSEAVLTAGTVIAYVKGFLGPEWDGLVTPAWRIRWDERDYEIDGEVERHKTRSSVRFLSVLLKRVSEEG